MIFFDNNKEKVNFETNMNSNLKLIMNMFKILRCTMVCAFLAVSTIAVNAQESEIAQMSNEYDLAYSDEVYAGYGTISGAGQIYMIIDFGGDFATGKYYYLKTNKGRKNKAWIPITASWDEYGTITAWEEAYGSKNGKFVGKIYNRMVFKGTFYRNDGKRFSFSINLKKT